MESQKQNTQMYHHVTSTLIINNFLIILLYLFLLCSLILSFCNTIFNLFLTLSLCNIYFYFLLFDIIVMYLVSSKCWVYFYYVFSFYHFVIIRYYFLLQRTFFDYLVQSLSLRCCASVLVPCALVFKMIILQPFAPKAKNLFIFVMT